MEISVKQRLIVMNGQKIVLTEQDGEWVTERVDKAASIKPGIYNIHLAEQAEKSTTYSGVVLHVDKLHLYQQVNSNFIVHELLNFVKVPKVGIVSNIRYVENKAQFTSASIKNKSRLNR